MVSDPSLNDLNRNILFAGVLSGAAYLHEQDLIHQDLKPANIMVANMEPQTPKITDFRSMIMARWVRYDKPGTINYLAPEQIADRDHDMKVDEWVCALIVIELITKEETRARIQTTKAIEDTYARLTGV